MIVLKKYVNMNKDLQLEVLYALQIAVAKLEHPPSTFISILNSLYIPVMKYYKASVKHKRDNSFIHQVHNVLAPGQCLSNQRLQQSGSNSV